MVASGGCQRAVGLWVPNDFSGGRDRHRAMRTRRIRAVELVHAIAAMKSFGRSYVRGTKLLLRNREGRLWDLRQCNVVVLRRSTDVLADATAAADLCERG